MHIRDISSEQITNKVGKQDVIIFSPGPFQHDKRGL